MKKTYIAPSTNSIALAMQTVIAGSLGSMKVNTDSETKVGKGSAWTREQNNSSFGSGMWEDMK